MPETIKSALFVDYESLHRSLAGAGAPGDTRLADRAAAWLAAIETGRLIGPQGTRRRLVSKRCYAGATVLGKQRDALAAAGFEVVDCGSGDAGGRGSADMHLAIDTIDALAKPGGADEFILLAASSDLAPLLARLKASRRLAAIYADASTPQDERALADALLDSAAFAEFLTSDEMPVSEERSARAAADRAAIEEFARRVHAATNIPLFSPKTYAELFKHLTDEIRENGYHFQTTAKNVADRMTETGRSVTRRQVVFIVKGLALKGHVFSTGDTPDGLAEVFREQARYLITNAGMNLDDRQDQLLNAWFVSRVPAPPAPPQAKTTPAPVVPKAMPNGAMAARHNGSKPPPRAAPEPAAPATEQASVAKVDEDAPVAESPAVAEKAPPPQEPRAPAKAPPAARRPVEVKPVELPKTAAKPAATTIKALPSPAAREEAKAVIAARIAASARLKPAAARPSAPSKPAAKSPAGPPPARATQPRRSAAEQTSDALETSILAAIAEAVDVLVDDGAKEETPRAEQTARRKPNGPPAAAEPQPEPEDAEANGDEAADGGDIGDQIQRIIASYNRNRSDE